MSGDASSEGLDEFKWAIENGDQDMVTKIVSQNNKMATVAFSLGRTPLHCAADYGQYEIASYLIDQGASIDVTDMHGITPILAAIFENHKDCVELLLQKGANKNGKSPKGSSYCECAETDEIKALLK